jgi:AraC-like DNA-binding protein
MSIMRHSLTREFDPKRGVSVSSLAREYPRGHDVPEHAHGSDQLIYASRGIMNVASGQSSWVIPPHFGLWIPARTMHRIHMPQPVSMRTLYLRRGSAKLAPGCKVLHVGALLRELIIEIVRVRSLRTRNRTECALQQLLVTELRRASPMPVSVIMPKDPRALAVAQTVFENPADPPSLRSMCASAGVSVRTLQRVFQRDLGTNFESWRRQLRLTKAIELLVSGCAVKEVAYSVGYRQPSAFVALFRATFGAAPKTWISALARLSPPAK